MAAGRRGRQNSAEISLWAFDTDVFVTIVLSFYDGLVAYFLVHVQKQQLGL